MAGRDNVRLAAALLLGAAIAFPLGMIVAGRGGLSERKIADLSADALARQVFSPSIASDPHFRARQRESADLLERRCRDKGEYCSEAAQLRRWLDEEKGR